MTIYFRSQIRLVFVLSATLLFFGLVAGQSVATLAAQDQQQTEPAAPSAQDAPKDAPKDVETEKRPPAQAAEPAAPTPESEPAKSETNPPAEAAEAVDSMSREEREKLQYRKFAPRDDKTIFSPLNLPTPGRIRTAIGLPGEDYWQQDVAYVMQVTLDAEHDSLHGTAQITYTNNSPTPLSYLWFNLEQNLFRSQSDGSKFTPPGSRFNNRTQFDGGLKLGAVHVGGQDAKLNVYDTLGRVDLPFPVASHGGRVSLDIEWSFNIPDYGADRMGIKKYKQGNVYEMAQWFPSVCKFDDVYGWNTLPYLGQGEFYSDFGSYDVAITVPAGFVVCATGVLQNPTDVLTMAQQERLAQARTSESTVVIRDEAEIADDQSTPSGANAVTWLFRADRVRTFAWTASAATIWDAAGIQWPDGTLTLVQSVYPQEAKEAWSQSTQMLRHSILHYSTQWFRYPYPSATNVNGVCGGMEYPMIIFCGTTRSARGLHGVMSHEIGHSWFPMIVNSDERRHAWMDEGFNTFLNGYDTFAAYTADTADTAGDAAQTDQNQSDNQRGNRRRRFQRSGGRFARRRSGISQPIDLPADQVRPNLLGRTQYAQTASGLRLLRETILGPDRFDPAFKLYISSWAFKSPQPSDFFRCMENAAGMNLDWFWRGWFIEDAKLDQAVVSVNATDSQLTKIELANEQEMVMPVKMKVEFDDGSSQEIDLPVYIWYYTNLWTTEVPTPGKSITSVVIDPDNKFPDIDRANNSWQKEAAAAEEPAAETQAEGG